MGITSPTKLVSLSYTILQNNEWVHPSLCYLLDPIAVPRRHPFGRYATNDLYEFSWRNFRFFRSFYPDSVITWNGLGPKIRKIGTSGFRGELLKSYREII